MKIKVIKKISICFFLISYIFFAAGLNVYAQCTDFLNQSCLCCHSKVKNFSNSSTSTINSNEQQCPCSVKQIPSNSVVQLSSDFQQPLSEFAKIFNSFNVYPDLIIFIDSNYCKIHPKPNIALNKNLDILRTVILLN